MTIVLDSGAVIASERNDARFAALLAAARKKRVSMLLPATVVAETWRGPSTHPRAARLLGSIDGFPELDLSAARRAGALLARSGTAAIVDGNVVDVAIAMRPSTIVTSDPGDVIELLQAAGISHELFGSRSPKADVVIIPL